jgi:hypothetical protein
MTSNEMTFKDPFSISEVEQYLQADSLTVLFSPRQARRINFDGDRYYYWREDQGDGEKPFVSPFYPSVTTVTKQGSRTGIGLLKWYASKGWDEARRELWFARSFGTLLHIIQAELSAKMMEHGNNAVDLDVLTLREGFEQYRRALDLPVSWAEKNWIRLCKALSSWRVFCIEYNVQFLLIEKNGISPGGRLLRDA